MTKKAAAKPVSRRLNPNDERLTEQERVAVTVADEFRDVEKVLEVFIAENQAVMGTYFELLEERNQKRQAADLAIRQLDVSYGAWDRYTERTNYDVSELYQRIGEKQFLALGGSIGMERVYTMEKERIELAIATKQIPPQVAELITKVVPSYHAPKPK